MKKFWAGLIAYTLLTSDITGYCFSVGAEDTLTYNDFTYIMEEEGTVTIIKYSGEDSYIFIPTVINGAPVTRIGACAFEDNLTIQEVVLPDTITEISYKAFADCKTLETIQFPDSLKTIGDYAFTTCHSLRAIDLNQVESIGTCAFQLCISVQEITVPGTIRFVPDHAFHGCSGVTSLTFEEGVMEIEAGAAVNMYSLQQINVADSVTIIGEHALGYTYYHPNYTPLDVRICGNTGSAAEAYAQDNGFFFMPLESTGPVIGDLNADHKLTVADIVLLARIAAEDPTVPATDPRQLAACDQDTDGAYTICDAILLLRSLEQTA